MNKKELEIILSKLKRIEKPKVKLEQYQTPSEIAADILLKAFFIGDIKSKIVGDFGCGNGIFGIGAGLLGAKKVIFIDIDKDAIKIAEDNSSNFSFDRTFILSDIKDFDQFVDTSFSNPPFGIQSDEFDSFVSKQISVSKVSYVLVPAGRKINGKIIGEYHIHLPRMFSFHKKKVHTFKVQCFRISFK